LFVAQAGLLSLGPVLPDVAREFGVSTAAAGQLRRLGGLAGGATAVAVALFGSRLRLRGMLTAGHLTLALGALGSAAAVGVRAATGQFGYLVGGAVGGAASRRRRLQGARRLTGCDGLLAELAASGPRRTRVAGSQSDWLIPGRKHRAHVTAEDLRRQLKILGVPGQAGPSRRAAGPGS
jgi:hypothetical protein